HNVPGLEWLRRLKAECAAGGWRDARRIRLELRVGRHESDRPVRPPTSARKAWRTPGCLAGYDDARFSVIESPVSQRLNVSEHNEVRALVGGKVLDVE